MTWEGLSPPYSTIVADPPWQYDGSKDGAFVIPKPDGDWQTQRGVESMGYSPMPTSDIAALPVRSLVADDAHLYLWVTNAFMVEGHEIARAWGFKPKTILTWVKVYQDDPSRVSMKTGYYFRGATEHVIFAVRGSLPLQTNEGQPTAYLWPRIGAHSVKPAAFGDLVERCSPGPYVELFARAPPPRLGLVGLRLRIRRGTHALCASVRLVASPPVLSGVVRFPAKVSTPAGVIDRAKLFVDRGTATLWQLQQGRPVEVARLEAVTESRTTGGGRVQVLVGAEGVEWTVEDGKGCGGCGNPMARFDPRPHPHTASV